MSALHIRWPKYWSFSISPSNEYTGLISFRTDWLDLLAVQETPPTSSRSWAIPGPLSKLKRRVDSLEATQWAPRDPRRHSRGERLPCFSDVHPLTQAAPPGVTYKQGGHTQGPAVE